MITRYEHEHLATRGALKHALEAHHGDHGVPYYSLTRGGVKFNSHVGVLQVAGHTIEVLPKIDRITDSEATWRKVLIDMLRKVNGLELKVTDAAALRLKPHSILDLYMELFLTEVAYLLRQGLVKSYRRTEGNRTALKGKLLFAQHIRQNLVHQERFYVQHSTYDRENRFNCILRQGLLLVQARGAHMGLQARAAQLLLDFPELPEVVVNEALWTRLPWSRKTEGYRKAMGIARLLLLNYHPDIQGGREDVLALMWDMNALWERYVLQVMRQAAPDGWRVEGQGRREFWSSEAFATAHLKPDIVAVGPGDRRLVLDTKWKLLDGRPSDADIRQLFAYQHRWRAEEGYLIYPAAGRTKLSKGQFHESSHALHVLSVSALDGAARLNEDLGREIWEELLGGVSGE